MVYDLHVDLLGQNEVVDSPEYSNLTKEQLFKQIDSLCKNINSSLKDAAEYFEDFGEGTERINITLVAK